MFGPHIEGSVVVGGLILPKEREPQLSIPSVILLCSDAVVLCALPLQGQTSSLQ